MRHSLSRSTIARRDQRSPERSNIDIVEADSWELTAALNSPLYNGRKMDVSSTPKWSAR